MWKQLSISTIVLLVGFIVTLASLLGTKAMCPMGLKQYVPSGKMVYLSRTAAGDLSIGTAMLKDQNGIEPFFKIGLIDEGGNMWFTYNVQDQTKLVVQDKTSPATKYVLLDSNMNVIESGPAP
jgi:hypothetical protein